MNVKQLILSIVVVIGLMSIAIMVRADQFTHWLNIPGHYDRITDSYMPSTSWATQDHDKCTDAAIHHLKQNFLVRLECSRYPLVDAVNLKPRAK